MNEMVGSVSAAGEHMGFLAAKHMEWTFRGCAKHPSVVDELGYFQFITGQPHPFGNVGILAEADDLESAEKVSASLLSSGFPAMVMLPLPPSERVKQHLLDAGFFESGMPAMACDIEAIPATTLPEGYEFSRVHGGAESDEWTAGLSAGYGLSSELSAIFSPNSVGADSSEEASVQWFLIRKDGKPVAVSMLHFSHGVAGIYCVATVAEERGKGLGAFITAEPLRMAAKLGYKVGVLQSSPEGHSVYERLGFADVSHFTTMVHLPA